MAAKVKSPVKDNKGDASQSGNSTAEARSARKRRNFIGSVAYTIFVSIYTMLLLCAVFNPRLLPLESFKKFEVLPRTYDGMKLFWKSFGMLDPIGYGLIYIVLTFGGYYFMLDREPFKLLWSQRCWNIAVALFSIWSSIRSCSYLMEWLSRDGTISTLHSLIDDICGGKLGDVYLDQSPMAFYIVIFIFSKYFEFLDTFFLIMHKKPLLTLHWWHHFSVSAYCVYGGMSQITLGIFFGVMNYVVHGYMYTYYTLASFGYRPSKWATSITMLQITQMVIGFVLALVGVYAKYTRPGCKWQNPSADGMYMFTMSLVIYGSYFILFAKFYLDRYVYPKKLKSS